MKRAAYCLLLLGLAGSAHAQTILLKNGQRIETKGVRRAGDLIMGKIEVAGRAGEVGQPLNAIAKIEFPEPNGLTAAGEFLVQGQPEKALAEVNPVVAFYEPFRDVPGSWWAPAAVIKVSALAALGREGEAETLAQQIQKSSTDPETARAASLRIANSFVRKQEFEKALAICETAIKESARDEVLADAWVTKGQILLAQRNWDGALLAFLHVPVFYQEEKLLMPAALLGSARAYRRLDDIDRAKKSLQDLISTFPKSAEAATAKTELEKL